MNELRMTVPNITSKENDWDSATSSSASLSTKISQSESDHEDAIVSTVVDDTIRSSKMQKTSRDSSGSADTFSSSHVDFAPILPSSDTKTWSPPPFLLSSTDTIALIEQAKMIVAEEASLIEIEGPAKLFGDIHGKRSSLFFPPFEQLPITVFFCTWWTGQLFDLRRLLKGFGAPDTIDFNTGWIEASTTNFVFIGDFVDRGALSLEVDFFLRTNRNHVFLNLLILLMQSSHYLGITGHGSAFGLQGEISETRFLAARESRGFGDE
jgi:hypothetical protein